MRIVISDSIIKTVRTVISYSAYAVEEFSFIFEDKIDAAIEIIKKNSEIPVILFPGSIMQLNNKADAILYLSLISGRNPDYLIGNHVLSSMYIKKSGMECLPTGYILIEGGSTSSTEYISNTRPIPRNKSDIVIATAVAGELLGN